MSELGIDDLCAIGRNFGGADLVGDVGDNFESDPKSAVAGQLETETPEIEDLLDVARAQHRHRGVVERGLGVRGQRRRFAEGIVAGQSKNAAVLTDSGEVGMAERVAGAIDAGTFPVPQAEHAVVFRLGERMGELSAVNRGGGDILVHSGQKDDIVFVQEDALAFEGGVVATEGRAAITADKRGGVETAAAIGAMLIDG